MSSKSLVHLRIGAVHGGCAHRIVHLLGFFSNTSGTHHTVSNSSAVLNTLGTHHPVSSQPIEQVLSVDGGTGAALPAWAALLVAVTESAVDALQLLLH